MAEPEPIDVRTVEPGTKLMLADNSLVEVTQNPADGYWVLARYLTVAGEASSDGKEAMIFWSDIVGKI